MMSVGRLYTRIATATVDEDLSNDSEVIKVDNRVKSTYNLMHYQSVMMLKFTWEGVALFGAPDNEVRSYSSRQCNILSVLKCRQGLGFCLFHDFDAWEVEGSY